MKICSFGEEMYCIYYYYSNCYHYYYIEHYQTCVLRELFTICCENL